MKTQAKPHTRIVEKSGTHLIIEESVEIEPELASSLSYKFGIHECIMMLPGGDRARVRLFVGREPAGTACQQYAKKPEGLTVRIEVTF